MSFSLDDQVIRDIAGVIARERIPRDDCILVLANLGLCVSKMLLPKGQSPGCRLPSTVLVSPSYHLSQPGLEDLSMVVPQILDEDPSDEEIHYRLAQRTYLLHRLGLQDLILD